MATLLEDQCIALIVQEALKAATAPIRTGQWGEVNPPGNGAQSTQHPS